MSAFALVISPAYFSIHLHRLTQRSPTQQAYHKYSSDFYPHFMPTQRVGCLTNILFRFTSFDVVNRKAY
ncbi:hypothetical protein [Glaesserella parasuis]|nr:hypothetical protein [Glaesserella parasuis]MDG6366710.1 hypothetical protein [Glaesserella parasuis]MDG6373075.1 hypothetical protein [Glaesserella parasuis]MDG6445005.1 hypothetical protein [Glaesserella parasuis]